MDITNDSFSIVQRIAVLSVHTSPLAALGGEKTGGMNVYIREFSRELARRGIPVDIFTRATAPDQPLIETTLGPNVRVINIMAGPPHRIPVDEIAHYLPDFAQEVQQFAQQEQLQYSLIYSHYWLSGLVAERLCAAWGPLPIVQMFHTLGYLKNQVAQSERDQASPARLAGEHRVMHLVDCLIAATPTERDQMIDFYAADPQKIAVIPPGVDLQRFQSMAKARFKAELAIEHDNILFVGRIERLKGIDTLIQATALLRTQHPALMAKTKVTIIGGDPTAIPPDPELERLYDLRRALQLEDVVEFVGAKEQAELVPYFAAADFVVVPSDYESFGMVALEAMATGTPVIVSSVGGLVHLVQDGVTGLTTPPRDPAALALRMRQLLEAPELRARLGTQASIVARQYDWSCIVERMLGEVYVPLIERAICCA
jgi:D-inositol-3-phosphate glycosyltransferase